MLQVSRHIAEELLTKFVTQGHALVQRASLVGDFSDYESWKAARKQWIDQTTQALEHINGGSEDAEEFKIAASRSEGGQRWQQEYGADVECVKTALDILVMRRGELELERGGAPAIQPAQELTAGAQPAAVSEAPAEILSDDVAGPEPLPERPAGQEAVAEPLVEKQAAPALERLQERAPIAENAGEERSDAASSFGSELSPAPFVGSQLAPSANGMGELHPSANGSTSSTPATSAPNAVPDLRRQVFVAHGRNEKWKQAVAQLLEHAGPHQVTVLNQRTGEHRTLVADFEQQIAGSHYAVVLLTADDVGAPRLESEEEPYYSPRARQGVVFEMGFLVAALTPECVCVLYEDGVELPCDLEGISYVRLDLAGTWQPKLLLQLRKAGFDYDVNKLAPV